ncbi:hypothetical protein TSMEX_010884, partial [Taenia solium]
ALVGVQDVASECVRHPLAYCLHGLFTTGAFSRVRVFLVSVAAAVTASSASAVIGFVIYNEMNRNRFFSNLRSLLTTKPGTHIR